MQRLFKNTLILLMLFSSSIAFSQNNVNKANRDTAKYIQMTGIVITDSMSRIPFAKIVDITTRRGVIADYSELNKH